MRGNNSSFMVCISHKNIVHNNSSTAVGPSYTLHYNKQLLSRGKTSPYTVALREVGVEYLREKQPCILARAQKPVKSYTIA